MDERRGPPDWRERSRGRSGERAAATNRRGGHTPRAIQRHPVYGGQAHRSNQYGPYIIGFVLVVAVLAGFLYVGLNWATGPGRVAALANPPTPTAVPVVVAAPTAPAPSPTAGEQVYLVQAGDSPASIAQKFGVRTDDLMAANNNPDPQKLQIGQPLKIPPPPGR